MVFTNKYDTAKNGKKVNTTVELLEEADLPWKVEVLVDYCPMFHSHHRKRSEAEAKATKMHQTYLSVHKGESDECRS